MGLGYAHFSVSTLTPFGELLCGHLRQRGWSQRHFAALVDINQAQFGRIVHGQRRPPLERMGIWAEKLRLSAGDAAEFAHLALLEHRAGWLAAAIVQTADPRRAAEMRTRYDQPT